MRPVLIRFLLDRPLEWFSTDPGPLSVGSTWLVVFAALIYGLVRAFRHHPWTSADREPVYWLAGAGVVTLGILPNIVSAGASLPVFGYGVMILIGFVVGSAVAKWRLNSLGYDGELAFSLGTWILLSGVIGARVFWLAQHGSLAISKAENVGAKLGVILNLSNGGLVLYGGVFAGLVAFFLFCWKNKIPALRMADVVTPSIFLGVGFGRLGCLLFGCCFGGQCDLPWAITFPPDSVTYQSMAERGLITLGEVVPLHPTQIYSSISGFLIAGLTASFFRHRVGDGSVFALACMTYPIARFLVEFLRNDELGQLGTSLTISQWISLGVVCAGVGLFAFVSRKAIARPRGQLAA